MGKPKESHNLEFPVFLIHTRLEGSPFGWKRVPGSCDARCKSPILSEPGGVAYERGWNSQRLKVLFQMIFQWRRLFCCVVSVDVSLEPSILPLPLEVCGLFWVSGMRGWLALF